MKYVAAYLLAVLGGNATPSSENVKTILSSVGIDADDTLLNKMMSELEGKDIDEIIANGSKKLAKFGGGPAAGAAASSAAPAAGGAAAAVVEEKKVEEEEADLGGGMDMFGGGSDY